MVEEVAAFVAVTTLEGTVMGSEEEPVVVIGVLIEEIGVEDPVEAEAVS